MASSCKPILCSVKNRMVRSGKIWIPRNGGGQRDGSGFGVDRQPLNIVNQAGT